MDAGHKATDEMIAEMEKKLKAHYKKASDEVQKKLDDYLKAFAAKDAKHYADLQKDFTKENYEEYIRWRRNQVLISERWAEMRDSLAQDYHNANQIAKSIIEGYKPEVYALNHNYGMYDIEHNALVDTSYTLYDRRTAERLMRDNPDMLPPPGKKTSQRIAEGKDVLWNKQLIQSSMMQSLLQGESIPKISKRLATAVGERNQSAAIRNARTMATGAQNAGRVDAYKQAEEKGIEVMQEWEATLNGRTRHSHRQLHGERIDVGGTFSNGCKFPGDPNGPAEEVYNCRCTLIPYLKGFDTDKVTYSPKLGEQSFEEWQNEHKKGIIPTSDDDMKYRAIIKSDEVTNIERNNKEISLRKVTSAVNDIYISDSVNIKPKAFHKIDKKLTEAYKMVGEADNKHKPTVYIISNSEMSNQRIIQGAYKGVGNVLFINSDYALYDKNNAPEILSDFACYKDDRSTYIHELFHWKDAEVFRSKFGEITDNNLSEYNKFVNDRCKKSLDKITQKGYNINDISEYATEKYYYADYSETYTEYRTKRALKEG